MSTTTERPAQHHNLCARAILLALHEADRPLTTNEVTAAILFGRASAYKWLLALESEGSVVREGTRAEYRWRRKHD